METNTEQTEPKVGAMEKRRVVMADGKRYLIYYTFGQDETVEENLNSDAKNDE